MLGVLASGAPASIAVTLLDGLVLARTAFHHSMNYRSVVMFGAGRAIEDAEHKQRVLAALLDKMVEGRSKACRPPNEVELRTTLVIAFPIAEAAAKVRTGPPLEDADEDPSYWAGVIPFVTTRGAPIT
jgi:nitroimidazol reductase NimA-like FMN-containing flavoprotein (pyridoxamine 5'-phosphate oxidase superfamily)